MTERKKKALVEKAREIMEDEDLAEALAEEIAERRGGLGFLLSMLKARPRTFTPFVLKGSTIYSEPSAIDRKTAELAAVSAATAISCEHCLEAHMARSLDAGASMEEIKDVILVASAICESSALSVAFRKYRQFEGKLGKIKG